jgi:hypothetical protein
MTEGEIAECAVGEADSTQGQTVAEQPAVTPVTKAETLIDAEPDALAKYRSADGTMDSGKILADLRQAEERLDGLQRKLDNPVGVTVEEMAEELEAIEDKEDREFAEKFIGLLGKGGLGKERATELLKGLAEINKPEDQKVFFRKELEKLGKDGKEVLGKVRQFRDTMRDAKEFSAEEVAVLEQVTQTADGVRLVAKILEKARLMDAGKFSNLRPTNTMGEELSNADKIRMYEEAFALKTTNPEKSRAEVARLDKIFAK